MHAVPLPQTHGSASLPHRAPYRHRRRRRYYHARARSCCHCWRSTHLDRRRCHTTHHHRKQHPPHINNNQTEKHKHTRNAAPLQSHISIVIRGRGGALPRVFAAQKLSVGWQGGYLDGARRFLFVLDTTFILRRDRCSLCSCTARKR
jgi:hypothetical protein